MSSVTFSPVPVNEIEELRKVYTALNGVARNLASFEKCVKKQDLGMAGHHLRAAEWHTQQAKKSLAEAGKSEVASLVQSE